MVFGLQKTHLSPFTTSCESLNLDLRNGTLPHHFELSPTGFFDHPRLKRMHRDATEKR